MRFNPLSISFVGVLSLITISFVLIVNSDNTNGSKSSENHEELFELSIIHISDFHARFDEINEKSFLCSKNDTCVGGYARLKKVVDYLKANRKNSIYLNAGDNFQGTYWYNLFRHNVTSYFLNLLPADAITIGNHDFAHGVAGLVPFLKSVKSPVVIANIDDHLEKDLQNLYNKSIIIERRGRKIGIIGVILQETAAVANSDNVIFTSEFDAINKECKNLRQQGVNIIIVLSHCGLKRDKEIALETGDCVDIIVGGHSHSFLYTSKNNLYPSSDVPAGPYPIIVKPKSGHDKKVLIVHSYAYAKYVGDLKLFFDAAGNIKYYDGNPIFLSNEIEKDPDMERELTPWRDEVNRKGQRIVGATNVELMHRECRLGECALGSFATDAVVHETQIKFPDCNVYAAIISAGAMRNSFPIGNITYAEIIAFMPFEFTFDILDLSGDTIYEVFEHSVAMSYTKNKFIGINMLQISGFHVTFNTTKAVGNRVQSLQIKVNDEEYEKVIPSKLYTIIVPSFEASGRRGYTMIKQKKKNQRIGLLGINIMESYIAKKSTVTHKIDGRIVMLT